MFGPPGDLLAKADQARSDTTGRERLFSAMNVREQVHFDAAGEVEASFDGRIDDGRFFDSNHSGATIKRRDRHLNEQAGPAIDSLFFDKNGVFMTFVLFPR
jgi:hypothetical protein